MKADDLRSRAGLIRLAEGLEWLPVLLARVTLGFVFVQSGWGKLHNLAKVTEFFRSLGIPAPELQAPFVAGVELVGGLLLLAGLLTRLASLPLAGTMVVAILTAKRSELTGASDLFGFIEWLYLALLLWLVVRGAGALSLDRLLARRLPSAAGGRLSVLEPREGP